mgnify:CR=1 FL=1
MDEGVQAAGAMLAMCLSELRLQRFSTICACLVKDYLARTGSVSNAGCSLEEQHTKRNG